MMLIEESFACMPVQKAVHNNSQYQQLSQQILTKQNHNKSSLLQVEAIKAASLTWRPWHHGQNYDHCREESVYEALNDACKYLHYCGGNNSSDASPICIEPSGDEARWADVLPAANSALKCLMPGNNCFIGGGAWQNRVSIPMHMYCSLQCLKTLLTGLNCLIRWLVADYSRTACMCNVTLLWLDGVTGLASPQPFSGTLLCESALICTAQRTL